MIYTNPSDEVLQSAHLVTLYDPQVPGWNLVLVNTINLEHLETRVWNSVDIPVDSANLVAIQRWREWVHQARAASPEGPDHLTGR